MIASFSPSRLVALADLALGLSAVHCVVLSAEGRVVFASGAVASTTCRRAPEIAGTAFNDLLDQADHADAAELIGAAVNDSRPATAPLTLRALDGTLHVIEFTARRVDDEVLLVGEPVESRATKPDHANHSHWHRRTADDVLPVCMDCQEVRPGDKWVDIQIFLSANNLPLSHGLCPDCFDERQRNLDRRGDADERGARV